MILGWQFLTVLGIFWQNSHPELRFEQLVDYIKMNGAIKDDKDPFEWTNDDWVTAITHCRQKETGKDYIDLPNSKKETKND